MPAGNFDEVLKVDSSGIVLAAGPLDQSVAQVTEMCVWVLQLNGPEDAIANAMGPPGSPMSGMPSMHMLTVTDLGTAKARWEFPLNDRLKVVAFTPGSATAMAIGVFVDSKRKQRAFFWSETVRLTL